MKKYLSTIGNNLRSAREICGLTQKEFSNMLLARNNSCSSKNDSMISLYENAEKIMKASRFLQWCVLLHVDPDKIIHTEPVPEKLFLPENIKYSFDFEYFQTKLAELIPSRTSKNSLAQFAADFNQIADQVFTRNENCPTTHVQTLIRYREGKRNIQLDYFLILCILCHTELKNFLKFQLI